MGYRNTSTEPPSLHQYLYRCEEKKEDKEAAVRSENKSWNRRTWGWNREWNNRTEAETGGEAEGTKPENE